MSHIKDIVHGSVLALDFSYRLSLCVCVCARFCYSHTKASVLIFRDLGDLIAFRKPFEDAAFLTKCKDTFVGSFGENF